MAQQFRLKDTAITCPRKGRGLGRKGYPKASGLPALGFPHRPPPRQIEYPRLIERKRPELVRALSYSLILRGYQEHWPKGDCPALNSRDPAAVL
jgi:hypothetical protein